MNYFLGIFFRQQLTTTLFLYGLTSPCFMNIFSYYSSRPVDFPLLFCLSPDFLSVMKLNWIHNCMQFSDFGFFSEKGLHDYHDCKSVLTRFDIGMHIHVVPSYVVYLHICFIFQQFKTSMHINVKYNPMFTMSLKSEDFIKKR